MESAVTRSRAPRQRPQAAGTRAAAEAKGPDAGAALRGHQLCDHLAPARSRREDPVAGPLVLVGDVRAIDDDLPAAALDQKLAT